MYEAFSEYRKSRVVEDVWDCCLSLMSWLVRIAGWVMFNAESSMDKKKKGEFMDRLCNFENIFVK